MKLISASILSADFLKLGEEIQAVEAAGADWLHLDIMDGHFVPNLTFGPPLVEAIHRIAKRPLDVHLMIQNPDVYLADFVKAGADILSVQVETCPHLHRTLTAIRQLGAKPAVVLNPHTPVAAIEWVLHEVEMVLLMSVNPGFGGQSFIPSSLEKAQQLAQLRAAKNLSFLIQMDGGIKTNNIQSIAQAGVDVFVVGSGIFQTENYQKTIQAMKAQLGLVNR